MNKKLLGIAAVALLGVSAAFAATTSTVYFTASGSLTKATTSTVAVAGINNENYGYIEDESCFTIKKYNGEYVLDNTKTICSYELVDSSKIENNNSSTKEDFKYLYSEVKLSDLEFTKKGDCVVIQVGLSATDDSTYTYTFEHSKSLHYEYENGVTRNEVIGYTDLTLSGTYKDLFDVRIGDGTDSLFLEDPTMTSRYLWDSKTSSFNSKGVYTYSDTNESKTITIDSSNTTEVLFLAIVLNQDVTSTVKFTDGFTFSLPAFTKN